MSSRPAAHRPGGTGASAEREALVIDRLTRRRFLATGGVALLLAGAARPGAAAAPESGAAPPFALGVASGDPTHRSVVLWTRLVDGALDGSEMPARPIAVQWLIATDPDLRHVVTQGTVLARPAAAHAVHVRASGLAPDTWYWYQFRVGAAGSPVGRTRTFPAPGSRPPRMRFAFASCQHWEAGYYTAYEHLAQEDLDFVVHLGDYIYEGGATPGAVRLHEGGEATTLADYRRRHAQYRTDPNLQRAHARFPFLVTWDDHEVENNYAGGVPADNDRPREMPVPAWRFRRRRADAYRAYFEHMPLAGPGPLGTDLRMFRRFRFGRLAQLNVLDTRQFRSNQPCGGRVDWLPPAGDDLAFACGGELDPQASMTGADQEDWLLRGLRASDARWNVIAQQVMMSRVNFAPGARAPVYNMDAWDGYTAARNRLLGLIAEQGIANVVVVTGDIHSSWVADLRADFDAAGSPVVATELVGTSITSGFPAGLIPAVEAALRHPANGHIRFFEGLERGYVRCDVDEARWRADIRTVATILEPTSSIDTLASFEVRDGEPGAHRIA